MRLSIKLCKCGRLFKSLKEECEYCLTISHKLEVQKRKEERLKKTEYKREPEYKIWLRMKRLAGQKRKVNGVRVQEVGFYKFWEGNYFLFREFLRKNNFKPGYKVRRIRNRYGFYPHNIIVKNEQNEIVSNVYIPRKKRKKVIRVNPKFAVKKK